MIPNKDSISLVDNVSQLSYVPLFIHFYKLIKLLESSMFLAGTSFRGFCAEPFAYEFTSPTYKQAFV